MTSTVKARLPRDERRRQILTMATSVFNEQGYHNAAMDDIAERAGVSKPVLYQHFEGKLELYLAVVQEATDALVARLDKAMEDASGDPEQMVAQVVGAFFEFAADPDAGSMILFNSDLMGDPDVAASIAVADRKVSEFIVRGILEETSLNEAQARLGAALACTIPRICAAYWVANPELPREEAVELAAKMAWGAFDVLPDPIR